MKLVDLFVCSECGENPDYCDCAGNPPRIVDDLDPLVEQYAEELAGMTEEGLSFPRIVVINRRGQVESGYYDQSIMAGGWWCDSLVVVEVLREAPEFGGPATTDEVMACSSAELHQTIYDAVLDAQTEETEV